jgi:hypothetical protein
MLQTRSVSPNPQKIDGVTSVLISLSTPPVLLGLIAATEAIQVLQGLGKASEEFFRGERLPTLNLMGTLPPGP